MAILLIISLPTALVIINTDRAANYGHLSTEAFDLASKFVEDQVQAAGGSVDSNLYQELQDEEGGETTTVTTQLGPVLFTTKGTVTIETANGESPCQAPTGSGEEEDVYVVTATVTWKGSSEAENGGPVSLSSEVAPVATSASAGAGEIAVAIENLDTTLNTTDLVYAEVNGQWEGSGSAPSVPTGETTSETKGDTPSSTLTENASGCIEFPGLDPAAGWVYSLEVVYCQVQNTLTSQCTSTSPELVEYNEDGAQAAGYNIAAPAIPTESDLTVSTGQVTIATPWYIGEAATQPVSFATYEYPSGGGAPTQKSPQWIPSDVAVGVQNTNLDCIEATTTCELGNASTAVSTSGSSNLYLYPYPDGYESVFAGDEPESNPLAASSSGASYYFSGSFTQPTTQSPPIPLQVAASADATETAITIPLYYVDLSVTCALTTGQTWTGLTFTEVDGGDTTYTDSAVTGASTCTTSTAVTVPVGLPLGQYELGAIGSGSPLVSATGHQFFWVTPFGVCGGATTLMTLTTSATNCSTYTWLTTTVPERLN